ncbi:MAG: folate-binding protein [Gammaproteobacteria bacterium]|jgi:folate-binding protein YgfZ|nr:folate-binding protein [Gammaproteobacteria bacterium]
MHFNPDFIKFLSNYGKIRLEEEGYCFEPSLIVQKESSSTLQLCPLLNWAWLKISGADSKKFLQGQLTCDMESVTAQRGHFAAHCNRQGQVIATFYIYLRNEAYYLHLPSASTPLLQKALQQYAKFSKVNIELAAPDLVSIGVIGINSIKALRHYFGVEPPVTNEQCLHEEVYLHRVPGEVERFVCTATVPTLTSLWQILMTHQATPCSDNLWHWYNIQAHLAHIRPKTSALFTPHAIALPEHHGVSFTKGCYTGQEIVARMHYLGRGKRKLALLTRNTDIPYRPGDVLLSEDHKAMGMVLDSYTDTTQKTQHLLAVLY